MQHPVNNQQQQKVDRYGSSLIEQEKSEQMVTPPPIINLKLSSPKNESDAIKRIKNYKLLLKIIPPGTSKEEIKKQIFGKYKDFVEPYLDKENGDISFETKQETHYDVGDIFYRRVVSKEGGFEVRGGYGINKKIKKSKAHHENRRIDKTFIEKNKEHKNLLVGLKGGNGESKDNLLRLNFFKYSKFSIPIWPFIVVVVIIFTLVLLYFKTLQNIGRHQ
ncbi:hypothetical protein JCM13304A_17130 [Desulfothermus okinawensis JCM 13304]